MSSAGNMNIEDGELLSPECLLLWGMMKDIQGDQTNSTDLPQRAALPPQCFHNSVDSFNPVLHPLYNVTGTGNTSLTTLNQNDQMWKLARKRSNSDDFKIVLNFLNLYVTPVIIAVGLLGRFCARNSGTLVYRIGLNFF